MTESDYEQRKLELDTQLRLSIRFLQQGYEAQLSALELEWAGAKRTAAPVAAPEAAPVRQRAPQPPGGLLEQVRQAVAQLPVELTKADVIRVLGFTPERSSLHRALDDLMAEREIRLHDRGSGRTPNVYRKLGGITPEGS
ncbi:MAG TPA: hypothetical protein VH988_33640 [Thermoanaerobaculia bacterium]|jgi:hypothetical protein|nr:hypothetical protein [Thermoanaerobaculia bacterium]